MKFKKDKTVNSPHIIKLKPFKIPDGMIIVVDTREQLPLFIEKLPRKNGKVIKGPYVGKLKMIGEYIGKIQIDIETVKCGDYTIKGFEEQFAIERKQISDFYSYIGKERKKTTRKMQQFGEIVNNGGWAALVVESNESDILAGFMMSKVSPEVARGFLNSWRVRYGLHSYLNRERKMVERFVLDSMIKFYNVQREVG